MGQEYTIMNKLPPFVKSISTLNPEKIKELQKIVEKNKLKWKPEIIEVSNGIYDFSGYPDPIKRYNIVRENFGKPLEESYFWVIEFLKQDLGFPYIEKIYDYFTASESSSYWGTAQQRIGIQQDKVTTYLATVGKMIKELFQLVRELRILDERLSIYKDWGKTKSADITLKGYFIDLVEGGSKNPASVYGLAQQVQFTILPDLFFNTHVYKLEDIDKVVDPLEFPKNVKNVLKRKLTQFISWVKNTKKELENRRKYTIKYLLEHWSSIKLYISWVKPYLRSIKRLSGREKHITSADIIAAFETSVIEAEFIAKKPLKRVNGEMYYSCILCTFNYRTRPEMMFQNEYQRGPIHVGRMEMELRAYVWSEKEIKAYRELRDNEDLEIMGMLDRNIANALEALGDDLKKYLEEAEKEVNKKEEKEKKKEQKEEKPQGFTNPFSALLEGFKELLFLFIPKPRKKEKKKKEKAPDDKGLLPQLYILYKVYKQAHGMMAW